MTMSKKNSGFNAMGKPIPAKSRAAAYRAYKEMVPEATKEQAMHAVSVAANALERDDPFRVIGTTGPHIDDDKSIKLDLTGRYRLVATLLSG